MNLYELADAYTQLLEIEDITPENFQMALDSINGEIDEKLFNIGRLVRNIEAEVAGIKAEEERLCKKRKAAENTVIRLKEYARSAMIMTGKTKSSDGVITWAIQNNPAKVEIDPDIEISHDVCKHVPESWVPDKNTIAQRLKGGVDIPGCKLVVEQGVRLK